MAPKGDTKPQPSGRFGVLHEPVALNFGLLSEPELLQLSVKSLTSPTAFDALNHPVPGGLYDLSLGPTEPSQGACVTCGLNSAHCGGHMGHISLAVPVYSPVQFDSMFRLLKLKCLSCHRLRLRGERIAFFRVKLMLLEANLVEAAEGLEAATLGRDGEDESVEEQVERVDRVLEKYERMAQAELASVRTKAFASSGPAARRKNVSTERAGLLMQTHARAAWGKTVHQLIKSIPTRACENCGAPVHKFRKDGIAKIFKMPLSDKDKLLQAKRGTKVKAAFEFTPSRPKRNRGDAGNESESGNSDSDSDSSDEDEDGNAKTTPGGYKKVSVKMSGTFLPVVEVEEQLIQLWKREHAIVPMIWGRLSPTEDAPMIVGSDTKHATGYTSFFLRSLPVPPSRFRPPTVMGGINYEHPQNVALTKVLNLNLRLSSRFGDESKTNAFNMYAEKSGVRLTAAATLQGALNDWISLQEAVNAFLDSSKVSGSAGRDIAPGVRQLLEKKHGLFRQNMMGKRVNYSCRSVISPDPYIGTEEVGVPVRFATKLTYPEPVNDINAKELANMVRNGPDVHPGAMFVEDANGRLTDLRKQSARKREDLANILENVHVHGIKEERELEANKVTAGTVHDVFKQEQNKQHAPLSLRRDMKVWRHLRSGDVMLANRQPTLHKPSIMGHKVRVIDNPAMQTIRLHYANCNTYNADFDGDEINLHFPQNELARAEAFEIAFASRQYNTSTNGEPLRGLIQDHVGMGLMLTKNGTFLTRDEYTQMVMAALSAVTVGMGHNIILLPPAIFLPRKMWTGKQVISTILIHLAGTTNPAGLLSMGPIKTKVQAKAWTVFRPDPRNDADGIKTFGEKKFKKIRKNALALEGGVEGPLGQAQFVVRQGILCTGVIDKAQIGASTFGLVHTVHELYGPTAAGELLSSFGRVFTFCSQKWGHTCAIEDLVLTPEAEQERQKQIRLSQVMGVDAQKTFLGIEAADVKGLTTREVQDKVADAMHRHVRDGVDSEIREAALDTAVQAVTAVATTGIIDVCLPGGARKQFPDNSFSLMVTSGAKGSIVNHTQVSCALGQQALEGRRVPRMVSGKSLPCFSPFDPTPRAGGYVSDRFLTGVRPQEYYFHCMAGREGLVDTAVKTSRSGYLQRCLIKHLEDLSVAYDRSVRSSDGSLVQFLYGGDGLDAHETSYLHGDDKTLSFLYSNITPLCNNLHVGGGEGELIILDKDSDAADHAKPTAIDGMTAPERHQQVRQARTIGAKGAALAKQGGRTPVDHMQVGMPVIARRVRGVARGDGGKVSKNVDAADLESGWHAAKITKVRASTSKTAIPVVDVEFVSDGLKVRKLPCWKDSALLGSEGAPELTLVMPVMPDPVMWQLHPDRYLGSINEQLQDKLVEYMNKNPDGMLESEDDRTTLAQLVWVKYMRSLAPPGENVGCLAAQSIGEPSTQMTLNTFHLAGHGGANVTLGIPRLGELLMTASRKIKTPSMKLPLLDGISSQRAEAVRASLTKLDIGELLQAKDGIMVTESLCRQSPRDGVTSEAGEAVRRMRAEGAGGGTWVRRYKIKLQLQSLDDIKDEFHVNLKKIAGAVGTQYLPRLLRLVTTELRRAGETVYFAMAEKAIPTGASDAAELEDDSDDDEESAEVESKQKNKKNKKANKAMLDDDSGDEAGSEAGDEEDGVAGTKRGAGDGYEDDDEEDEIEERKDASSSDSSSGSDSSDSDSDTEMQVDPKTPSKADKKRVVAALVKTRKAAAEKKKKKKKKAVDSDNEMDLDMDDGKCRSFLVPVSARLQSQKCFVHCKAFTKGRNSRDTVEEEPAHIEVCLEFPASTKKLLMVGLAQTAADKTVVRTVAGVSKAYVNKANPKTGEKAFLQTDGCNFKAAWELSEIIDVNHILSNDVGAVLDTYGVEAARACIALEINNVFGAYHIDVDPRHLGLVADYMTYEGGYRPLNRIGIDNNTSPFLRMTFETSAKFLTAAALHGEREPMESPSARICMGQVIETGSGGIDILVAAEG